VNWGHDCWYGRNLEGSGRELTMHNPGRCLEGLTKSKAYLKLFLFQNLPGRLLVLA
jgi:hypothetical protein